MIPLDKAIEILSYRLPFIEEHADPDFKEAYNLAINCMGYVQMLKLFPHEIDNIPLPAESKV